jgi:methyl-accepting chemotaxis protein
MSDFDKALVSVKKLESKRSKMSSKLTGAEEVVDEVRRSHRKVLNELEKVEELMDETNQLINKLDLEYKELNGIFGDPDAKNGRTGQWKEGSYNPDDPEQVQKLKEDIQGYARLARQIHENIEKLEEVTQEVEEVDVKETTQVKEVLKAEHEIEGMSEEIEKLDQQIAKFMEKHS